MLKPILCKDCGVELAKSDSERLIAGACEIRQAVMLYCACGWRRLWQPIAAPRRPCYSDSMPR